MRPSLLDFKYTNRIASIHKFFLILLTSSLIIGANLLSSHIFLRYNFALKKHFSLSQDSLSIIQKLQEPITIYLASTPSQFNQENKKLLHLISKLAKEYSLATKNNPSAPISIQSLNPFDQSPSTQEIISKFNIQNDNTIIIASPHSYKFIPLTDLFTIKDDDITAFHGERLFTSAILDVTNPSKQKVYFLESHGELNPLNPHPQKGLSEFSNLLHQNNLDTDSLNLSTSESIPQDASLIAIISPKSPFLPHELRLLQEFLLDRNGKLFVCLDPASPNPLHKLLLDWGILSDDKLIIGSSNDYVPNTNKMIIQQFADHPITQFLLENNFRLLVGYSRPVRPLPSIPDTLSVSPLLFSSKSTWAESHYSANDPLPHFNESHDILGPVPIATLSEIKLNSSLNLSLNKGKIIACGNSSFLSNSEINAFGNKLFLQNTFSWLLQKNSYLNITPTSIEKFQLSLSSKDFQSLFLYLLIIPSFIAFIGIIVHYIRKN